LSQDALSVISLLENGQPNATLFSLGACRAVFWQPFHFEHHGLDAVSAASGEGIAVLHPVAEVAA
jgi:hypothetical protein